ncbi:MAG: hypothetical protein LBT08_07600 [Synergistaceae bacterium]|nr:hypothetical protein [Synergistaceae bacterium]
MGKYSSPGMDGAGRLSGTNGGAGFCGAGFGSGNVVEETPPAGVTGGAYWGKPGMLETCGIGTPGAG